MKRRKIVKYQEVKRRKIFSEENLNNIKEELDTNELVNILCNMKNMSYDIIVKSPRIKYIETILSKYELF